MPLFRLADGEEYEIEEGDVLEVVNEPNDPDEPGIGSLVEYKWDDGFNSAYVRLVEGECGYCDVGGTVFMNLGDTEPANAPPRATLTPEKEQELALAVLDKLKVIDPNVCIVGGAPAAWDRGESCNDIDVFISLPQYMDKGQCKRHIQRVLGSDYRVRSKMCSLETSEDPTIQAVMAFRKEGKDFDIICTKSDPSERYKAFPYSHTQIMWKGEGETQTTSFYDLGKAWKIVTKTGTASPQYTTKTEAVASRLGWEVAQSPSAALNRISEKMGEQL